MHSPLLVLLSLATLQTPLATVNAPLNAILRDEITLTSAFEQGSMGRVERRGAREFRVHVQGQQDQRGRNRAATWYAFRMDHVRGQEITLTLTDFVGEYNDVPGACPMGPTLRPAYSEDLGATWSHLTELAWDDTAKEATVRFTPTSDSILIATQPMYPYSRLASLLADLGRHPAVRIESIGQSVQARPLSLVTVTDFEVPDDEKRFVWLQARQHAWEAGTSFVMEGALKSITSDTAEAAALRQRTVFLFTPMCAPDGCALGLPRFNVNGFDPNRHWDEVDLRDKRYLERLPEVWYVKKAIVAHLDAGRPIHLMLNLHNTETAEYISTLCDDAAARLRMQTLYERLLHNSTFAPSGTQQLRTNEAPRGTTNSLFLLRQVPVMLMEQRIGFSEKLQRYPTVDDRLTFGAVLIRALAEACVN